MLEILKDINLQPKLFGIVENQTAILKENKKQATLNLVKITHIEINAILFTFDNTASDIIFQGNKGENTRCDYILINKNIAYFIELKSSEKSEQKHINTCIKKFKATECVLDYIDSVIYRFYGKEKIFSNLERRYILIYKAPSINKLPINNKKTSVHSLPENMLKLPLENEQEIDVKLLS